MSLVTCDLVGPKKPGNFMQTDGVPNWHYYPFGWNHCNRLSFIHTLIMKATSLLSNGFFAFQNHLFFSVTCQAGLTKSCMSIPVLFRQWCKVIWWRWKPNFHVQSVRVLVKNLFVYLSRNCKNPWSYDIELHNHEIITSHLILDILICFSFNKFSSSFFDNDCHSDIKWKV